MSAWAGVDPQNAHAVRSPDYLQNTTTTRDIPGYVTRGTQYDTWSTYQGQYSVIYRGKCMGGAVLCHFQGQVYGRGSVLSLSLRDINRTIKLESIHSSWPVSHHACCVTTAAAVSCSRRTRRRCRCSRPLAAIYPGCSSRQRFMRARCASLAQMCLSESIPRGSRSVIPIGN